MKHVTHALLTVAALACAFPAAALSPSRQARMVAAARELLGTPYQLGGRLRNGEGTDCQGVLFYAAQAVQKCGWKSFSVFPTVSIPRGELGSLLFGGPVATDALDLSLLEPADVVQLVGFQENPAEPAIGTLQGRPAWVWHTGLYSGDGKWIVGDHIAGHVVEVPLLQYLRDNAGTYAGAVFTRMSEGPRPARCRQHAPMRLRPAR